jgi:phage-related holin
MSGKKLHFMNTHFVQKTVHLVHDLFNTGKLAFWLSPLVFFQKYLFDDPEYLVFLCILIFLDTSLGIWHAFRQRQIDPEKFGDILVKIVIYAVFIIVGHILANFTVSGDKLTGGEYLKFLIYLSMIVKEALSIFKKTAQINPKLLPKWLVERLKGFDETGDLSKLTQTPNPNKDE